MIEILIALIISSTIFGIVWYVISKTILRDKSAETRLKSIYKYLEEEYPANSFHKNRIEAQIDSFTLIIKCIYHQGGIEGFQVSLGGQYPKQENVMMSYPEVGKFIWQGNKLITSLDMNITYPELQEIITVMLVEAKKLENKAKHV